MRLGIDLDGVVVDFNAGWMARYNAEFGTSLTADMVTKWNSLGELCGFEHMGQFWRWARGGDGPSIFRDLPFVEGAAEALDKLALHHSVIIITAKPQWAVHDTFAWIAENKIPTREVHITAEKWQVPCDVYLDDSPYIVPRIAKERPGSLVYRFVRPWNAPVPGTGDIHNWEEFTNAISDVGD